MPWCEECSRFWNPNSMRADGACPTCGRTIAEPGGEGDAVAEPHAPWHFKLMVVSVVVYLGWRAWQGVDWVIGHL